MAKAFVGGIGWLEKQTKTVNITGNGTHNIYPDAGKLLEKVIVNANVPHYDDGYSDGYATGYAEAKAVYGPATITYVSTLDDVHLNSDIVAGQSDGFWWEYDGYHIHYYEFSKAVKGGKIQINGVLGASFSEDPKYVIAVVYDGVVAISQDNLVVSPIYIGGNTYTITLPDGISVNGIFLNNWEGNAAPVCTYIE